MKRIICLLLAIIAFACSGISAFAADSVVEYNNASEFVFNPTDKDLFQDFKNVMPGDKTEQKIVIKNTKQDHPITVYLKAEIDNQYKDFLDQMDIDIYYSANKDGSNRVLLQSGRASETGKLAVNTKLGTYQPNESGYITVSLFVHPEMNNDYKNTMGKVKWIFTVEEGDEIYTIPSTKPSVTQPDDDFVIPGQNPSTGITYLAGGIALGAIALSGIGIIIFKKKSKEEENKANNNDSDNVVAEFECIKIIDNHEKKESEDNEA